MILIEQLKQIPDHRDIKGKKYSLWVILFMSLMGSLCGYIGYRPLADFAALHQEQLEELLELPPAPSTPSYSTFRRILLAVEPQHLAKVFNVWALGTMPLLPDINSVVMVNRVGTRDQKPVTETVYYLSSQCLPAATYLHQIQSHWAIENRLHWVKDVTFSEDYPTRVGGHAPVNWAIFFTWIVTLVRPRWNSDCSSSPPFMG